MILAGCVYVCQSMCRVRANSLWIWHSGIRYICIEGDILHIMNFTTIKLVWGYHAATAFHVYVWYVDKTLLLVLFTQIFCHKSQAKALRIWILLDDRNGKQ